MFNHKIVGSESLAQKSVTTEFEELNDADLIAVVGGTLGGFLSKLGEEVDDIGEDAGEELFGEDGILDPYDFIFG